MILEPLDGDCDLDYDVDHYDLNHLTTHWHTGDTWFLGDLDFSGMTDADDLELLLGSWGTGRPLTGGPGGGGMLRAHSPSSSRGG